MNCLIAAGQTMLLAYEGQLQIAAHLAAKAHHLMRLFTPRVRQSLPDVRPK